MTIQQTAANSTSYDVYGVNVLPPPPGEAVTKCCPHTDCDAQIVNSVQSITNLYLLTPRSRVLLAKLTGSQLVKKFSEFNEARRFITAFTSASDHYFIQRKLNIQKYFTEIWREKDILVSAFRILDPCVCSVLR